VGNELGQGSMWEVGSSAIHKMSLPHSGTSSVSTNLVGSPRNCVDPLNPPPQTCGKIERFHQTIKRYLDKRRPARSVPELQRQVDRFVVAYNEERPHRARGLVTPKAAFDALDKARPGDPVAETHFRVRTDKVDSCGKVTLRHDSKLFHIAIGRRWKGTQIRLYVADLDVRIMTFDRKLLRQLTLDTMRTYQPSGLPRYRVREGSDVPR
jgi:hypothetical protein